MQGKLATDCDGSVEHGKWQEPVGTLSVALAAYTFRVRTARNLSCSCAAIQLVQHIPPRAAAPPGMHGARCHRRDNGDAAVTFSGDTYVATPAHGGKGAGRAGHREDGAGGSQGSTNLASGASRRFHACAVHPLRGDEYTTGFQRICHCFSRNTLCPKKLAGQGIFGFSVTQCSTVNEHQRNTGQILSRLVQACKETPLKTRPTQNSLTARPGSL